MIATRFSPCVLLGASSFVLLALGMQEPHPPNAEEEWGSEQAAELFQERCLGCHAAPDPSYETDRAWLGQLPETA